jgi:hypothetical protein
MIENENGIDTSSLNRTKDRVIVNNNTHTIYEHLKSLENDPKHHQRWIWELTQNAQDVNITDITIKFHEKTLAFSHNGLSFSEDDITHLIFHGPSKPLQTGKRGKFGTDFITTHLISYYGSEQTSFQHGKCPAIKKLTAQKDCGAGHLLLSL